MILKLINLINLNNCLVKLVNSDGSEIPVFITYTKFEEIKKEVIVHYWESNKLVIDERGFSIDGSYFKIDPELSLINSLGRVNLDLINGETTGKILTLVSKSYDFNGNLIKSDRIDAQLKGSRYYSHGLELDLGISGQFKFSYSSVSIKKCESHFEITYITDINNG